MNESGASSMQCTYIDEIIAYRIYGGGVRFEVDQRKVELSLFMFRTMALLLSSK